ncbi:hypothetical protein BASA81_008806 [Batrachochytrium salamandrivorans]|nr:hypothetical protein BASA81_008806 [Batrachochytrium salamandrivorans]
MLKLLCAQLLVLLLTSPTLHAQSVLKGSKQLAGTGPHILVRQGNGQVFGTGSNTLGQLGINSKAIKVYFPTRMAGATKVTDLSAGDSHSCVVENGQAKCTGSDKYGQLGDKQKGNRLVLAPVFGLNTGVMEIYSGPRTSCTRMTKGGVKCWGAHSDGNKQLPQIVAGFGPTRAVASVAIGDRYFCFLTIDGKLYCMGSNEFGQLGVGNTTVLSTPTLVLGLNNLVSVACGYSHTCAVTSAGGMYCWGFNYNYGQLGNTNVVEYSTVPVPVTGLVNVAAAWAGGFNSFAVLKTGAVMGFGENVYTQLGSGTGDRQPIPIPLGSQSIGVAEVRGGSLTTCILQSSDGQVKCVGSNGYGQMGVGSKISSSASLLTMTGFGPITKQPTSLRPTKRPTLAPTKRPTKRSTKKPTPKQG